MKDIIIVLSIIAFASTNSFSQVVSNGVPAELILKWSPLSLINPVAPAVQFGVEHQFSEQWTHQHELGFMWDGNGVYDGDFWGVRSQNEVRYYIPAGRNFFDIFFDRYLSLQLTGRHLNYRNEEITVWRDERSYRQLLDVDADYNDLSLLLGTGKVVYFGDSRFMLEYGAAGGVRFINRNFYNLPSDAVVDKNNNNMPWDPIAIDWYRSTSPVFNIYFKVGYILN